MKVTVCELASSPNENEALWQALVEHVQGAKSELVLLPEMPFYRWLAATRQVDQQAWERAVNAHEQWLGRLVELGTAVVISSRPVIRSGKKMNEGYIWERDSGYLKAHHKYYLPDEEAYWEATWYERGSGRDFNVVQTSAGHVGFLICTELWFNHHGRTYAGEGIELLVCPRATPTTTTGKWIAGGRAAAVVSGAFCLSSNFEGIGGWIIEPEEGEVLGVTSPERPFLSLDIDLQAARRAKNSYPRYVPG
jgi:N-carbamoylputrescine amidase